MRVSLPTYGSRGDVVPMAGREVQLGAPAAEVRVCAPPSAADLFPRAAEECDASVATGVIPTGGWR